LTNREAKNFFKEYNNKFELFSICEGNGIRPLTKQDMDELTVELEDPQVD
jgi:hypothetical protein